MTNLSEKPYAPTLPSTKEEEALLQNMVKACASTHSNFITNLSYQLLDAVKPLSCKDKESGNYIAQNAALMGMQAFKPQDEAQAMMAAQLVGLHHANMECLKRAMLPDQSRPLRDYNLRHASKLTHAFAKMYETLQRAQGNGLTEQKITVQHVQVNHGGQAIVGEVTCAKKQ